MRHETTQCGIGSADTARLLLGAFLLLFIQPLAWGEKPVVRPFLPTASCYYVRAPQGQEWHIRFNGEVRIQPGIGLIVHDKDATILVKTVVPPGPYTAEKPYVITVPAGKTEADYRIVLSGHHGNLSPQVTPITDLPKEVFSGPTLAMPHNTPPVYFMVPEGLDKIVVSSRMARLDIRKPDNSVPHMGEPVQDELNYKIEVQVSAGVQYWIKPAGYMGFYPTAYFAYAPERLFTPDPAFEKLKWWRLFDAVK